MTKPMRRNRKKADNNRFADIVETFLFPMFPGTVFDDPRDADPPAYSPDKLVRINGSPTRLRIRRDAREKECINIRRSQPFSPDEKQIITNFLKNIKRIWFDWYKPFKNDTASSALSQVVAESTSQNSSDFLLRLITKLTDWAQETYEGNKISFSIGIDEGDNNNRKKTISFEKIEEQDFLKVLTNGQDTLLIFNKDGRLKNNEFLPNRPLEGISNNEFNPFRFEPIGFWTADGERIAITLTRNGEILVFKNGSLFFCKRRGRWRYFPHDNVITRMAGALSSVCPSY